MSERPIRILRVVTRLNAGGPSRHIGIIDRGLDPRRFETLLVHGRLEDGEAPIDPWPLGRMQELPRLGRPLRARDDLAALRSLRAIVRDFRPDLVHTHQAKAGMLGRLAAGKARRVHTFHGHTFSGYWSGWMNRALRLAERRLALRTDALVVQSPRQGDEIAEALGDDLRPRLRLISPGVDFAEVARRRAQASPLSPRAEGERRVAFVARLAPVKDVLSFLEVVAPWVREDPKRHRVVIAGRGDRAEEARARRRGTELGVDPSWVWTGHLDHPASLFADVDVVVCSSRNEGTPLALIEALACGARIASYDHGGIVDTLGFRPGVVLAKRGDQDDLRRALRQALESRSGSAEDHEALVEAFDGSRLVRDLAGLYEELVSASTVGLAARPTQ